MLTSQEHLAMQEIAPLDPPPLVFHPWIQSTPLQEEIQPETENRDLTPSEIDVTCDITNFKPRDWIQTVKTKARAAKVCAGN